MSRFVLPKHPGLAKGEAEPPDGFRGRLVKYVRPILSPFTRALSGASFRPNRTTAPNLGSPLASSCFSLPVRSPISGSRPRPV
jgi:hypothetical protein